jgi:hypothetical protein
MFLPLLEESQRDDGAGLVDADVRVHTADAKIHTYRIFTVRRHATDRSLARDLKPGEQRLVLQTSEGPTGTVPKLLVGARLIGTADEAPGVTPPPADPRPCHIAGDTTTASMPVVVLAAGLAAVLILVVVLRASHRRLQQSRASATRM